MGQLDEVSQSIGALDAKVSIILNSKSDFEERIDKLGNKVSELHLWLVEHDLPQMKKDVDDMKKNQWVRMGIAGGAGMTAGGMIPWLKTFIGNLFT